MHKVREDKEQRARRARLAEAIRRFWASAPHLRPRILELEGAIVFQFPGVRRRKEAERLVEYLERADVDIAQLLLCLVQEIVPAPMGADNKQASADLVRGFGERVRQFRRVRGWTQAELAIRCGFSHSTMVANYERSGGNSPNLRSLILIARALGVSLDELVGYRKGERGGVRSTAKAG